MIPLEVTRTDWRGEHTAIFTSIESIINDAYKTHKIETAKAAVDYINKFIELNSLDRNRAYEDATSIALGFLPEVNFWRESASLELITALLEETRASKREKTKTYMYAAKSHEKKCSYEEASRLYEAAGDLENGRRNAILHFQSLISVRTDHMKYAENSQLGLIKQEVMKVLEQYYQRKTKNE